MTLRKVLSLAAATVAFAAGTVFAQAPGRDFSLLNPPQPTDGGGKIEVIEFFWYACGHCYSLEPFIEKWAANLPKDVVFKRMPAVPNEGWGQLASVYYTLDAMGQLDKLHKKVFEAIHKEQVNLNVKKTREEWLAKQGIDLAKYAEVEKSFSVVTRLNRAKQLTAGYKVEGVPMVVVNGKYVTSSTHVNGDATRVMPVVDRLIDMARKEAKSAEAPAAPTPKKLEIVKK